MAVTISAFDLAAELTGEHPIHVLDVRYRLDKPDGRDDFAAGHIPGAVYVDLDKELAEHGAPELGRHPVPSMARLQKAARRWGVHKDSEIVIVDDFAMMGASRAWWLLDGSGFTNVRVLDGGMKAWRAANGELETGEGVVPEPSDVEITSLHVGLSVGEAAVWPEEGTLVDVRVPERYRGETEPLDPIAGHVPGAVNLPGVRYLAEDGTLRSPEEIQAAFAEVSAGKPVALYCGSGITAAQAALAAASAGIDVELFPGSWSAWSNTPGAPIATGAETGGTA
ncbi:sulfurtransferase [Microbacterium mitrae]|uniref:Sulfurtransferase n=1 Tax=Microbacterium mitrae TaxID=664640 RepID=A0A5C8HPM2_9MICO|nr:sulfurtransferase [Microbacterium mitrae]TXK04530.1 sulfurtransferase [Microbacterium mitrae]